MSLAEMVRITMVFKRVLWRILNYYEAYERDRFEREGRPPKHIYNDLVLLKAWLTEIE